MSDAVRIGFFFSHFLMESLQQESTRSEETDSSYWPLVPIIPFLTRLPSLNFAYSLTSLIKENLGMQDTVSSFRQIESISVLPNERGCQNLSLHFTYSHGICSTKEQTEWRYGFLVLATCAYHSFSNEAPISQFCVFSHLSERRNNLNWETNSLIWTLELITTFANEDSYLRFTYSLTSLTGENSTKTRFPHS